MSLTDRERKLLAVLILLVIAVFGTRLLVLPAYHGMRAVKTELLSARENYGSPVFGDTEGDDPQPDVSAAYSITFMPKPSPEALHYFFESLAGQYGLEIQSINISQNNDVLPDGFTRVDVRIYISGGQSGVMDLLEEIERGDTAVAVGDLSISPSGGSNVDLNANFHVYCDDHADPADLGFTPGSPGKAHGFRFTAPGGDSE